MADAPQELQAGGNRFAIGTPGAIVLPPRVFRVRLTGLLFDTDKCFLLPGGLQSIRAFRKIWAAHPNIKVLVVGHADRAGAADHNQKLSERRAESIKSYLTDDVDGWLAFYSPGVPPTKLWGATEDQKMLSHLGFATVAEYQSARGLAADGAAGPNTRRALITDYMAEDETQKPATVELATHGCGESHPEIPTADGVEDQRNRRVEVFLFEDAIKPGPTNPCPQPGGCPDHEKWKGASQETIDLGDDLGAVTVTVTDQRGAPVAGADVHLSGFVPEDGVTDATGIAGVVDVLPMKYEVFARKQGFTSASAQIDVPAGATVPVALTIEAAGGALEVLVRDATGTLVMGATVAIAGPDATADSKTTDGAGRVVFGPVPSGDYQISASAAGFVAQTVPGSVQPDQTTTVVVTLAASLVLGNARWEQDVAEGTKELVARLLDHRRRPCGTCDAVVLVGPERLFAQTDSNGVLRIRIPEAATSVTVQYTALDASTFIDWPILLDLPPSSDDAGAIGRLRNLGYPADVDLAYAVYGFQRDQGLPATTTLDAATRAALAAVHDVS